jgi:hypothetical protein
MCRVGYDSLMEVSDVRRRLRGAIEEAKRRSAERRVRADEASRAWERVLPEVAVPAFHTMASALTGEGHRFKVATPGEAVRLTLERSAEEFVELALDTQRERPALLLTSARGRGRRLVSNERIVGEGDAIAALTEDAIIAVLLEELIPFLER